jgi:hypothetical protein
MTINKFFLVLVAVCLYIYVTSWVFNHMNAWVGIGIFVLGIYISSKQVTKHLNEKK